MDSKDTHCIDLYQNIANKNAFVKPKNIHLGCVSVYFVILIECTHKTPIV